MTMLASAFGYDPENDDGFILNPATNLNGTANHETGHYLNLYHTFTGDGGGSNCPADVTCGTDSDCCPDVPPHKRTSGCPADNPTGNECTNGPNTYIHNFMDYADDACFHGFSENQKTRMEAALNGPRVTLGNAIGDNTPAATYPATITAPNITNPDQTMGIYDVTLNGVTFKSWSSHHDGGYVNRVASAPRVNLAFATQYTMTVQVGVGNASNNELVNVYIDYDNDGSFTQPGDEVYVTPAGSGKKNGDTFSFMFTTPAESESGAPPANQGLRMRIISDFDNGTNALTATTVPSNGGQIEDYTLELAAPAPVELIGFTAKANKASVNLNWQTSSESSNMGFEIQRKEVGNTFRTIGWIEGHGTSTEKHSYFYEDTNVQPGITYYYQLKQIDFNGRFEYSDIKSVELATSSLPHLAVFPNPASNTITVIMNGQINGAGQVHLYAASGQLMESRIVEFRESRQIQFDLSQLAGGVYLVQAIGNFEPQIQKVLVNK